MSKKKILKLLKGTSKAVTKDSKVTTTTKKQGNNKNQSKGEKTTRRLIHITLPFIDPDF